MRKEINKKSEPKIDWMDSEALAAAMCGLQDTDDRSGIEDAFYRKFAVELEAFESIIEALWPMVDFGISPLTDTPFIGLADNKGDVGAWILNKDITSRFINGVIQWLGGDKLKKGDKGMLREVTKKGKIEYKITIIKP